MQKVRAQLINFIQALWLHGPTSYNGSAVSNVGVSQQSLKPSIIKNHSIVKQYVYVPEDLKKFKGLRREMQEGDAMCIMQFSGITSLSKIQKFAQ